MNAAGNDDRSPVLAAALRQRYDDRLRRGIDSVRRMVEETTQRDARVLEAMKSDPDTAKFAVARSQEIMDSAVTSEKEEEIVSLLHTLAQRDVDVKVLEDEAVRLREEVASLKEKQRDDSDDLAKRVQMHERVMQGEIALKAEVAEMRQSLTTTADAFRKREQDLRLAMDEEHKKDVEYIRENAAEELQRAHERALQQEERMREEQAHALEQTDKGHAREIERMVKEKIADRESMQAHGLEGEVARLEKTLMRCEERETESRTALAAQREEFNSTVLADRKELEAAHVKALALEVEMARAQHAETELRAERDGLRVKYVAMGKRCEELSIKLLKQREAYANVHRDVAQTAHEKLRAWKARSAERARASDDAVEAARNEAAAELLAHSIELGQLQTQIAQMRETSARHRQAYERYEELRERHEELVASSAKNEESHVQIELELRRVVSSAKAADARHVAELTVFEEKAKMQRALDAATRENKFLNREVELSREVEMRRVGDGGPLQARQLMPGGSIGFSSEEGGKERTRMRTRRGSSAHARSSSSSLRPSSVETPAPRGSRYRDGRRDRDRDSDRDAHHGGVMYSDVREAQRRADEAEKEVKELKEKMEAEKAALEAKVAELQETVAGHVHAHASLAGERAHLVQHVTHGSATVERLTAMVESEKDRVREARAMAEAEAAAHERVHANALAGLDALDAARCAQAAAASAALRAQAAAALTIAEQHRRALERRCAEREYAHSELSGELESHRAQIETHHSEMSRVRERHDEAHSRLHANGHRHRSVHSAVQQLRSDVAALRRDATLSMRVVRDAMENDIARLGIKLPGHTGAAVTQHKAKLAVELKAQHDRALEAVHREHTQALEDARSELLATQRKHAETHESREEVSRRKEELARSLQDVRAKLATTEDAHAVHRGKHEEHLSAHMMTQMQILAHRKMVRALSGEVRKLRVDVALRMEDTMREVNATMTTMASKTVAVAIARGHMHAEALAKCAQLQQRFDALQVHSDKLELDVLRIPVLHAKNASLQRSLDASADLLRAVFTKISPGSVLSPEALSVIAGARVDDDFYASNGVASLPKLFDALAERQSAGGGRPVDTAPSGVLRADRVCREFASALAELHSAKGVALRDGLLRRRMGEFESLHEQALIEAAGTRDAADRVPLALIADAPAVHVGRHAASYRERALSMRVKAPHFMMPSPTAAAPSSVVVWMEAHWHHQLELVAQRHSLRASAEAEGEARTQERDASLERAESSRRARTRQIIAAAERVDIYATHNRALDVAETSEVDADVEHRVVVDLNDLRAAHRVQQSSRDRLRTIMQDMSTLAADIERTITETGSAAAGEEERARSVRERSEVAREAESLATQRLNELRALVGAQAKSRARTYEAAFERFAEGMGVHNRAAAKESAQKVVDEWQAEVGCFERTSGGVDGRGGNENSTNGDGLKGLVIPEDEVSTVDDLIAKSVAVRAFDKAFQFEHTAADYDGEAATRRREEEDDEGVNPLSQTNQSICTVLHAMRLKADHVHAVVEELGDDGVSLLSLMDKPGEASALTRATQDELERCVSAIRDELVLAVEVQVRRICVCVCVQLHSVVSTHGLPPSFSPHISTTFIHSFFPSSFFLLHTH